MNRLASFITNLVGWFNLTALLMLFTLPFYVHKLDMIFYEEIEQEVVEIPKKEVFGFLPYWVFDERIEHIDYDVLTTIAYFGVDVHAHGNLDLSSQGYKTYMSDEATEIFDKAHASGTRVVLTITQMNNRDILALMNSTEAQDRAIEQTAELVKQRGLDGVNIDFEYMGDPGETYREKFTTFTQKMSDRLDKDNEDAHLTVSVYASAAKYPKIYNLTDLAGIADGIFMMAYDFAVSNSQVAMPTSPLFGHEEGEYWYDVSTAVDDFLAMMPADKLILGLPWYGYNYPVPTPEVKAPSYYRGVAQTIGIVQEISDTTPSSSMVEGWDDHGKVGFKAYNTGYGWRMVFIEDVRSLSYKYDFAKEKDLGGVGMWAIGFQESDDDMWALLREKFGTQVIADAGNLRWLRLIARS